MRHTHRAAYVIPHELPCIRKRFPSDFLLNFYPRTELISRTPQAILCYSRTAFPLEAQQPVYLAPPLACPSQLFHS